MSLKLYENQIFSSQLPIQWLRVYGKILLLARNEIKPKQNGRFGNSYLFLFWVIRNKEIYLMVKCLPVQILNLLNIDVYQWFTWSSNVDFFCRDAFLFPVMYDINASTIELSNDLKKNMIESSNAFQSWEYQASSRNYFQ